MSTRQSTERRATNRERRICDKLATVQRKRERMHKHIYGTGTGALGVIVKGR